MRIKGTNEHLKYHRRRLYRKYGTTKCWFLGKRNTNNCCGEHDTSKVNRGKGCNKYNQKEFFWECKMELISE